MTSRLAKIKGGTRNVTLKKYPGTDQAVAIRVLTNAEIQAALFATVEHFKRAGIEVNAATVEAFDDEHTTQLLAVALRDPDDPGQPFATNAHQLRGLMTSDEKEILVDAYEAFKAEVSPSPDEMSEDELLRLCEELKKKPEIGNTLNICVLRRLLPYLAGPPSS